MSLLDALHEIMQQSPPHVLSNKRVRHDHLRRAIAAIVRSSLLARRRRFEVFLVALDPTLGREIQKTRLCVVISPDEMNRTIATVLLAPMTTRGQSYPSRIACHFQGKDGHIILDQIRAVDKRRLLKHLGQIATTTQQDVLRVLAAMFAP